MDFRAEYEKWCTDPYFDDATNFTALLSLVQPDFAEL